MLFFKAKVVVYSESACQDLSENEKKLVGQGLRDVRQCPFIFMYKFFLCYFMIQHINNSRLRLCFRSRSCKNYF